MNKMKKSAILFAVMLFAVACFSLTAVAEELVFGDYTYVVLEDETVKITGYNGTEADVTVPSEIDGKAVTVIGEYALKYEENLTSLVIPGSVKEIAFNGIYGCDALTALTVEEGSLESLDNVRNCKALKKVTVPSNVTSIGTFMDCYALEEISVAKENTSLKSVSGIVYSADMKTLIKFPQGKNVAKYIIPDGVEKIAANAFYSVAAPVNVYIPLSVKTIDELAFAYAKVQLNYEGSKVPAAWSAAVSGRTVKTNALILRSTSKITSTQSTSAIKLSWEAVKGVDGYKIYLKTATGWKTLGTTTKTTVTYDKLKAGTKYTYAVKSGKKVNGQVVWADGYATHETATKAGVPSKVTSAQNTSAIKLTWTAVSGADGYRIYYKKAGNWVVGLSSTTGTSHTFNNAAKGIKITFAVRPYIKTKDTVIWSDYVTFVGSTKPETPSVTVTSPAIGQIDLTWSAIKGADSYQVYYKNGNGAYKLYNTYTSVKKLSFKNLQGGATYTFAVRACVKTTGGLVRSAYEEKTVTLAYRTPRYLRTFKNGIFKIRYTVEGITETFAVKPGAICVSGVDSEGDNYSLLWRDDIDRWVYLNHYYKVCTMLKTSEVQSLGLSSVRDMIEYVYYEMTIPEKYKTSTEKISGKSYFVESYTKLGVTYKFYYDGATLARITMGAQNGNKITLTVHGVTNKVNDSEVVIPNNYEFL